MVDIINCNRLQSFGRYTKWDQSAEMVTKQPHCYHFDTHWDFVILLNPIWPPLLSWSSNSIYQAQGSCPIFFPPTFWILSWPAWPFVSSHHVNAWGQKRNHHQDQKKDSQISCAGTRETVKEAARRVWPRDLKKHWRKPPSLPRSQYISSSNQNTNLLLCFFSTRIAQKVLVSIMNYNNIQGVFFFTGTPLKSMENLG